MATVEMTPEAIAGHQRAVRRNYLAKLVKTYRDGIELLAAGKPLKDAAGFYAAERELSVEMRRPHNPQHVVDDIRAWSERPKREAELEQALAKRRENNERMVELTAKIKEADKALRELQRQHRALQAENTASTYLERELRETPRKYPHLFSDADEFVETLLDMPRGLTTQAFKSHKTVPNP